jgi:transcriptional regulator of heat shock response
MLFLTRQRYLYQPYSSSGRVPTDKGYRFLVEEIQEREMKVEEALIKHLKNLDNKIRDFVGFSQELIKELTNFSSGLILSYIFEKDFLWEEGWKEVLLQPELKQNECLRNFIKLIEETERKIQELVYNEPFNSIRIFIGKENPIIETDEFSIITCRIPFPKTRKGGVLALLGPKRMPYKKNLRLIHTVSEFLTTT